MTCGTDVKANPYQPDKQRWQRGDIQAHKVCQVGTNSDPPDGTSLFIAAPVRFVRGVSEKGKIPTAELKNGMQIRIPHSSSTNCHAAFITQARATSGLDAFKKQQAEPAAAHEIQCTVFKEKKKKTYAVSA